MKLLNKTTIYYLLLTLPVFAVCSGLIYFFISSEIKEELDENLWKEKISIEQKLRAGIDPSLLENENIVIRQYTGNDHPPFSYYDEDIYNSQDNEVLPYRNLHVNIGSGGKNYELVVRESYVESDDLIFSILVPIISMFILLLLGFLLINFWISRKLWKPFYDSISRLQEFELGKSDIRFSPQKIKEFDMLNNSLNGMIHKAHEDYLRQKEFSENAAHEIQTPLAIIQNKIELLIQSKRLGKEEMQLITGIHDSANRLSHLNRTLLLLTKIENRQFAGSEMISLKKVLEKSVETYHEHIGARKISLSLSLDEHAAVKMNPVLCEILFNNLVLNAIRHNTEGGNISIVLNSSDFSISNTGTPLNVPSESLFGRFKKDTSSPDSIGLGLSIVRSICTTCSMNISHQYTAGIHTFRLTRLN